MSLSAVSERFDVPATAAWSPDVIEHEAVFGQDGGDDDPAKQKPTPFFALHHVFLAPTDR
jgi:hypothetical protein